MSGWWHRGLGLLAIVAALVSGVGPSAAQELALPTDLDAKTAAALQTEIQDAADAALPTRPLLLKVLEGRSKGATDEQILGAVRSLRERLGTAAELLGRERGDDVLVAAAGALYAGADRDLLHAMAEKTHTDALGMALVVLGDLIRRGVPTGTAGDAILSLGAAGANARDLRDFRESINGDIREGLAPTRATEVRLRGALMKVGGVGGMD